MGWQSKAKKMAMGKYVRAHKDQMVLITFTNEPVECRGLNFRKEEVDELDFPVNFYEVRSIFEKYQKGEAAHVVETQESEAKIFAVQGGPLLRELLDLDGGESIIGRTFVLKHTGEGQHTKYSFTEVFVTKQTKVFKQADEDQNDDDDSCPPAQDDEEAEDHAGPNPKKEPIEPPTKKRAKRVIEEDPDKEAFKEKVAKRAKKIKEEVALVEEESARILECES
jgi:hypothetical protein